MGLFLRVGENIFGVEIGRFECSVTIDPTLSTISSADSVDGAADAIVVD